MVFLFERFYSLKLCKSFLFEAVTSGLQPFYSRHT